MDRSYLNAAVFSVFLTKQKNCITVFQFKIDTNSRLGFNKTGNDDASASC